MSAAVTIFSMQLQSLVWPQSAGLAACWRRCTVSLGRQGRPRGHIQAACHRSRGLGNVSSSDDYSIDDQKAATQNWLLLIGSIYSSACQGGNLPGGP